MTDFEIFIRTIDTLEIEYSIEVKGGRQHIVICDRDSERVAQFIFDVEENFKEVFKS